MVKSKEKAEKNYHENVDTFGDAKVPHVNRVSYRIVKREDMLKESAGSVNKVVNLDTDGPLENTEGTCFCPKIFGQDRSSIKGTSKRNYNEKAESFKRSSNIGHINMPVPITHPGAISKKYLQRLFSLNDVNTFMEVADWSAYIFRPYFTDDRVHSIYQINKFIEENEDVLESQKDIKVIKLNNSYIYAPEVVVQRTREGRIRIGLVNATKKTQVAVVHSETRMSIGYDSDGFLDIDSGKITFHLTLGEHSDPVMREVNYSVDLDKIPKGGKVKSGALSQPKKEVILVVKEGLFSLVKQAGSDGIFLNKLRTSLQMLTGSYALMDLLTDIDVNREVNYLNKQLKALQGRLSENMEYNSIEEIPTDKLNIIKGDRDLIKAVSLQYRMMVSLKRQNCEPKELVSDLIPVIPLEYRNRIPISTSKSRMAFRSDKINVFYNNMIENSKSLWTLSLPSYDELNYKSLPTSEARLSTYNNKVRDNLDNMIEDTLVKRMKRIQTDVVENIISANKNSTDKDFKPLMKRIGSKKGKAREDAQGKRIDNTARGVITPNSNLELDEIGIPYDILKVHFRRELIEKIYRMADGNKLGKSRIGEIIDNLGDRFVNKIKYKSDETVNSSIRISFINKDISDNFGDIRSMENLVLSLLKDIVTKHRYLAVRFPSLHHLNGLGYRIRIVFSQTIHLNPLVCAGYNADFDGDQMSLFLLSLPESIKEVDTIISPIVNDMGADGRPLMTPTQDMIMGLYLMTLRDEDYHNQPVKASFSSFDRMVSAYDKGKIDLEDKVQVLIPHYENSIFNRDYRRYKVNKLSLRKEFEVENYNMKSTSLNTSFRGSDIVFGENIPTYNSLEYVQSEDSKVVGYKARMQLNNPNQGSLVLNEIISPQLNEVNQEFQKTGLVTSTVGRFIFNSLLPQDLGIVDRTEDKFSLEWDKDDKSGILGKELSRLVTQIFRKYSSEVSSYVRDLFKDNGYHFVTLSGVSLSLEDIKTSSVRDEIVERTYDEIELLKLKYDGKELEDLTIKAWEDTTQEIKDKSMDELDDRNPVKMMALSGARGKDTQIAQMIGIRGIMMDANNNKIPVPILENFSEGLSPISYITSSYGSCKGIIDRSNKTAETGDLARHLMFGNSSVIITDGDCGDSTGFLMTSYPIPGTKEIDKDNLYNKILRETITIDIPTDPSQKLSILTGELVDKNNPDHVVVINNAIGRKYKASDIIPISKNVVGRTPVEDIIDRKTGNIIFYKNIPIVEDEYNSDNFRILDEQYMTGIKVRSIQTCKSSSNGYCARCFGYLFPKHRYSNIGDSVGSFVAHSLSEPGTQMTMRTFHTGGVADGDTSAGFEQFKSTILFAKINGLDKRELALEAIINFNNAFEITADKMNQLATFLQTKKRNTINETMNSIVYPEGFTHEHFGVSKLDQWQEMFDIFYKSIRDPMIANGLDSILSVNFEVTARQATSNLIIVDAGESDRATGQIIKIKDLIQTNINLLYNGYKGIIAVPTIDGFKSVIPDIQDPTKSLIFQNVVERITELTIMGADDNLTNPMTALMVGNVMPLGENISYYKDKIKIQKEFKTVYDVLDTTEGTDTSEEFEGTITPFDETVNMMYEDKPVSTEPIISIPIPEPVPTPTENIEPPLNVTLEDTEEKEFDPNKGEIKGF